MRTLVVSLCLLASAVASSARADFPTYIHVVREGETLASIAQKYYKNRGRAKDIQDANYNALGGKTTIRPGQTLIIP